MKTVPAARAMRRVCARFSATSTIWACPLASKCVKRFSHGRNGVRRAARAAGDVEIEPVPAEQFDGFSQPAIIEGLANVAVGAQQGSRAHVTLLGRCRQDHNRQQAGAGVLPQFSQDFQAVDLGQVQVDERHAGEIVAAAIGIGIAGKKDNPGRQRRRSKARPCPPGWRGCSAFSMSRVSSGESSASNRACVLKTGEPCCIGMI
ncbi:MAG: hypothetical protein M5R42_08370 [Rhodocyclaceae bacterium]|nr:hypothetical protein [Rhodocyclaceae bacterium]